MRVIRSSTGGICASGKITRYMGKSFKKMAKEYKNPIPTVDILIAHKEGVVLIERKNIPYGWAIPGGYVDYNESVETTAYREAKEETNLDLEDLQLFNVYSEPGRDPRHHTITIVFTAKGKGELKAGDDAKNAGIYTQDNLPSEIAFDHAKVLEDYFVRKGRDS